MRRLWGIGGFLLIASTVLSAGSAHAQQVSEVFKCRNEQGQITYTNDRRQADKQKCTLVTSQGINVAPAGRPSHWWSTKHTV